MSTMPDPLTRERFLADPGRAWSSHEGPFPTDWLRDAWASTELRDEIVYELARSVSKTGGFALARQWVLDALPQFLNRDETAELYKQIREEAERDPHEWRPYFEVKFGELATTLPDSKEDLEWWQAGL